MLPLFFHLSPHVPATHLCHQEDITFRVSLAESRSKSLVLSLATCLQIKNVCSLGNCFLLSGWDVFTSWESCCPSCFVQPSYISSLHILSNIRGNPPSYIFSITIFPALAEEPSKRSVAALGRHVAGGQCQGRSGPGIPVPWGPWRRRALKLLSRCESVRARRTCWPSLSPWCQKCQIKLALASIIWSGVGHHVRCCWWHL